MVGYAAYFGQRTVVARPNMNAPSTPLPFLSIRLRGRLFLRADRDEHRSMKSCIGYLRPAVRSAAGRFVQLVRRRELEPYIERHRYLSIDVARADHCLEPNSTAISAIG